MRAAEQRLAEPAADRGGVRVDVGQHVGAVGQLAAVRAVAHEPPRRLIHADLARRGGAGEALRGGRRLADQRRDDVAGADAERQRLGIAAQLGRGAQRAQRVVLVGHRRAERHQQRVAAQLGHAAAVARAGGAGRRLVALGARAQRLGVLARHGEAREQAGDAPPHVRRERDPRDSRRACRRGDVVAQDRRLERAQLRRGLDAEPVDERLVGGAIGLERLGLAAAAVQREHLLAAQALAQRVRAHERLELAGHLVVAPARQVGVDAVGQAREPQVLQARDLRLGEPLARHVGERRAAPQRERAGEGVRGLLGLAAGEHLAAAAVSVLEAVGVERDAHAVAARLRDQRVLADRGAQPRRHDLHGVAGVLRALALPQLVGDPVQRDDRAAVDQQQREQRERAPARHAGAAAVAQLDLDRPEDPDLADHRCCEPIRAPGPSESDPTARLVSLRA